MTMTTTSSKAAVIPAMSNEPTTRAEVRLTPIGKRYIQMHQLVAEEILPVLEKAYEFVEMIHQACEEDGSLDPDEFVKNGLSMLDSALKLDHAERMLAAGEEDEDEYEDDDA